ncbi:hypothetical protein WKK05_04750 [Nostoc sp. UHCC 0302]|uniref:hypothetical protein n=1 Tax=Nostoc sp. UHCC 0302 TaxID=3134896 RepID=UPI00311CD444
MSEAGKALSELRDGFTPRLFAIADCTAQLTILLKSIAEFVLGVGIRAVSPLGEAIVLVTIAKSRIT